jgi:hypothetical protein
MRVPSIRTTRRNRLRWQSEAEEIMSAQRGARALKQNMNAARCVVRD